MRLPSQAAARSRPGARTVLLAIALTSTAVFGLQQLHGHAADAAPAAPSSAVPAVGGTQDHPAGTPDDHHGAAPGGHHGAAAEAEATGGHDRAAGTPADHHGAGAGGHHGATAEAPRTADGGVDHTAMTLLSGQMDGPSSPTNRVATAGPVVAHAHLSPVLHWLRDAALAVPAVLAALVLGGAALRRARPGRQWTALSVLAGRSLAASSALALASPGHGLLFGEGGAGVAEMGRVLLLTLPFTTATLVVVAALAAGRRALTRPRDRRLGRTTVVAAALAGLLSSVVALPVGVATAAPPTKGGGGGGGSAPARRRRRLRRRRPPPARCAPPTRAASPTTSRRSRSRSR